MGEVHQLLLKHGLEEARRVASGDKNDRVCVEAAHATMCDEKGSIGIAHAGFAMAALPHKKTAEAVWEREGGPIKLLIESGLDSQKRPIGVPYGSIARMILLYLQTQAVKTRSREVELGTSMNAWRSLAIDLYVWMAYLLHVLMGPVEVSWAALKSQFGPQYRELRFFRRDLMPPLNIALSVYPEAQTKIEEKRGITLYPSAHPSRSGGSWPCRLGLYSRYGGEGE